MRSREFDRRAGIVAAAAVIGLLGSGCSPDRLSPFADEPTRAAEAPAAPPEPAVPGDSATALSGVWEGTYTCNQGLTRLRLTLTGDPAGRITGVLRFSADPSNPSVPTGSYTVNGTLSGDSLRLRGDSWISRPGVYLMVSLDAELSSADPDQIQGTVDGAGCTTFTVRRS
ncbi:hypothetical protein [Spirillospora sp. NPDC029432]|uniref:hypothetical protein n=1 Tax=Spirillospora sp. NPDC029432 TaxID=3154599 RepID=UPI0034541F70